MEKLESPYMQHRPIGLSKDYYTGRQVKALWEKVDEIVNWINEIEKKTKKMSK